jgi:hypothetical protein
MYEREREREREYSTCVSLYGTKSSGILCTSSGLLSDTD